MGLLHASILNTLPYIQLAAICEKSALVGRFLRPAFKEALFVNNLDKLAHLNLDIAYITTPIPSHFSVAKTILLKEIARNLFVEKTLASHYIEAKELGELADSSGGIHMVGYPRRFSTSFKKARELLVNGTIGKIVSFKGYAYSSDFLDNSKLSIPQQRGGLLRDLGCHILDLALWFFGDLEIESSKYGSLQNSSYCKHSYLSVTFGNGSKGEFDVSRSMEGYRMPEVGLKILGTNGTIEVNDYGVNLKPSIGGSQSWPKPILNDNIDFWLGRPEFFHEDYYFTRSVLTNRRPEPSFITASKVDLIIEQIEERMN